MKNNSRAELIKARKQSKAKQSKAEQGKNILHDSVSM